MCSRPSRMNKQTCVSTPGRVPSVQCAEGRVWLPGGGKGTLPAVGVPFSQPALRSPSGDNLSFYTL